MWHVPFVNFPEQFRQQEKMLLSTIRSVLDGGDLIMRQELLDFEEHLAAFVGTRQAVGVSNCTDALRLIAHAFDVGPDDEVVTVAHTFVATMSPFKLRGAVIRLVDIADDHLMDPTALTGILGDRTKIIIPVHLNGRICDMDAIGRASTDIGAVLIEDAAQALGATYRGRAAGTFGRAAVFSFYPAKLLGALGDAGAVVTDDESLANELRLLRDHGRIGKELLGGWGYNCRLDNLQAAVLDARLHQLPDWIERRRQLAERYHLGLSDVGAVKLLPGPTGDSDQYDVFQNFVIETTDRDSLVDALTRAGIETLVSWRTPLHHQRALGFDGVSLPRTERLSARVVSLPLFPELEDKHVDYVVERVRSFYGA